MREPRYYIRADGLARIESIVKRFRSPAEPEDHHDLAARDLVETLERWSVHPDLKWASHLIIQKLWGHKLCEQSPNTMRGNSIFTIRWHAIADKFRAIAARKKRN